MHLGAGLARSFRRAAWRAGLIADRTRSAARHVERVLDTHGRESFERSGVPGLAVVVRFAEGRTITRCFGVAGGATPMRVDAVVPALSLSKPVTAMCAMALVDRKELSLDEPVWRRMRSFSFPAHRTGGFDPDGITLRRLLSHGAGLSVPLHGLSEDGRRLTPKELIEREPDEAHTLRLVDAPGTTLRYSGGGYSLVEQLIEDATGVPFARVARERVLRPLGMNDSDYELTPDLAARLATPHDGENLPMAQRRQASTAASGLYSTAHDLAVFWSSLVPGSAGEPAGRGVISPESCREMLTPQVVGADGTVCGLGFYLRPKRSDLGYAHLGFFGGWNHHAAGFLRRRVALVAFSNGDRGRACVSPLVRELSATLYEWTL